RVHKVHSLRHELLSTRPLHERPHTFSCCPLTPKRSVTRVNPLTSRQLNRACHAAARLAEIDKPVSLHSLATALPIVPSAAWACARPSHRKPASWGSPGYTPRLPVMRSADRL